MSEFVHKFVPGEEGDTRTLLLLHGTGGSESDLLDMGREVAPSANLLSPRGKVMEGDMTRFFRRFSEGVYDIEDLKFRAGELSGFVRESALTYGFDPADVYAFGYSNGANIAAAVLLLRPKTLAGAVLLRPTVPLTPDPPPDLSGAKVLISAGRGDRMVSEGQSESLAELLRACRAEVELIWQPTGHSLTRGDIEVARQWFTP